MDFIKFLIYWVISLFRSKPKPIPPTSIPPRPITPIALEFSAFRKLPPELILCISSFLQPESALSFSLCCKRIYFTIGKQCLDTLTEDNIQSDHRYKFLTLLERDLPDHILCYYCNKFHAINEAPRYMYSSIEYLYRSYNSRPCWREENRTWEASYIHWDFCFIIFQMAMKRYRQGIEPSTLLSLLSSPTRTSFQGGYTKQCSTSTRIVAGSLLLRQQTIFLIPATLPVPVPWGSDLLICPHVCLYSCRCNKGLWPRLQLEDCTNRRNYRRGDGCRKCKYCVTEFRVDFKASRDRTTIMFVTTWMNLGQGYLPIGWDWQSHVNLTLPEYCWRRARFERGSVCAGFEGKKHFEFEFDSLLTPQDKLALLEKSPYSWPEFDLAGTIIFR